MSVPCGKNGCGYLHHLLLHDDARYQDPRRPVVESIHTHSVSTVSNNVLLKHVPVTVYGRQRAVHTFAFVDSGSTGTFIEKSLVDDLGLEGSPHPLTLKWTGNIVREEKDSKVLSLKIAGADGAVHEIAKAHTLQRMSLPVQSVCASDLAARYDHLKNIPLRSYNEARPQIIIGVDNERLAQPQRHAAGGELEPIAAQTPLGWIVYGIHVGGSATRGSGESSHSYVICANSTRDIDKMGAVYIVENKQIELHKYVAKCCNSYPQTLRSENNLLEDATKCSRSIAKTVLQSQYQQHQQDSSLQDAPSQRHHCPQQHHTGQRIVPLQQPQQPEQVFNQQAQRQKRHRLQAIQQRQWQGQQRQRRQQQRQAMLH